MDENWHEEKKEFRRYKKDFTNIKGKKQKNISKIIKDEKSKNSGNQNQALTAVHSRKNNRKRQSHSRDIKNIREKQNEKI